MAYLPQPQKRILSTLPLLLTSLTFLLTTILLTPTPTHTINFPLFTLNTTSLTLTQNPTIPDYTTPHVYNLYLRSYCSGYYWNHTSSIVGLTCSSSFPANLSPLTNSPELTTLFTKTYFPSLQAATAFYILSLIFFGAGLLAGLWYTLVDERFWKIAFALAMVGEVALIIACILTTVVQRQGTALINQKVGDIGVEASYDDWFLGLTWLGMGFGVLGVGCWGLVGLR